ncbi:polar amino acid transport system ATP-binding protein [Flavobacterium sp. 7E]|uniref:ATP-binding cassette domain-containing protein n=1 Tax=unclassified Flavobacterium TaxID=196869 RepID=UPI0015715807|nr:MULTISPECIES: ATP-binding cassette domain-containing protein [unclassified Flavobacterium]MBE0392544.1 Sulfate/thiosulfate import ATP-binding protein CysA [Flavobacterium sp. PL002]NRS87849.1 polar amino acid transport system ATP-binding protein [Flavobacterium sp. 7E]
MEFEFRETLLYVENISVAYDGVTIIKDVSLTEKNVVRPNHANTGQIIAFVGRSGRGKSTFFKALTGLVQPDSGTILIKDFKSDEINAAKPVKEGSIGFVNQKYTLFRHKTVFQTLKFALRKTALSEEEKATKINKYIIEWGLENCENKYPNELSGGQRQRTAIIEQLFSSDKLVVLDEPFSGLDIGNIEEVKRSFDLLSSTHDHNTVIFSTHDIELAIELAQSIYVIGYPTVDGIKQTYGSIVAKHDLREMGICWKEKCPEHDKLYKEITLQMMNS